MLDLKSRLCRLYLHSTPNPSFDKGGACCKHMVCHLRCGGCWGLWVSWVLLVYWVGCLCSKIETRGACSKPTVCNLGVGMLGMLWSVGILVKVGLLCVLRLDVWSLLRWGQKDVAMIGVVWDSSVNCVICVDW